jgi:hypothetical protein
MRLTGSMACRPTGGSACVTLVGRDERGEPVHVTLVGTAPEELPARLDTGTIEALGPRRYRISDGRRIWNMEARAYLHHDLAAAFYAALPPRRPSLARRLFWRAVLAGAASRPGRWWLKHRSG